MGLWLLLFDFMGAGGGIIEDEVSPSPTPFGLPNLIIYSHPATPDNHD